MVNIGQMEKAPVHSSPSSASILLPVASASTDLAEAQETVARLYLPGPPCRRQIIRGWHLRQLQVSVTCGPVGGPRRQIAGTTRGPDRRGKTSSLREMVGALGLGLDVAAQNEVSHDFEPWWLDQGSLFSRRQPAELFAISTDRRKASGTQRPAVSSSCNGITRWSLSSAASSRCSGIRRWSNYRLGTPQIGA